MSTVSELMVPALEMRQGRHRLYAFAVEGKELPTFTTVSRVHRDDDAQVHGYQRPEVLSHINEIRAYIESLDAMVPNALVVAFDSRVRFEPLDSKPFNGSPSRHGTLRIPIDDSLPEDEKPGWLVDGQQRAAAIRDASVESFTAFVTAFITDNVEEQRAQFILVNSTKPLPKGLINELLPTTNGHLPSALERRKFPAYLLDRLNYDADSPFRGRIRTPTTPDGAIKDNSVLRMLENSLSDGALYRYRDPKTGTGDVEAMLGLVKAFWQAVANVFDRAWNETPRRSRLVHGAGIVSLGFVMDAISDRFRDGSVPSVAKVEAELRPMIDACSWTNGYWDFGPNAQRKWNELQNTSKDIQLLANYLLATYRARVWNVHQHIESAHLDAPA